jgi:hypothetical protein
MKDYCDRGLISPDGWSRPCGLPLDVDGMCPYTDHNEDDRRPCSTVTASSPDAVVGGVPGSPKASLHGTTGRAGDDNNESGVS